MDTALRLRQAIVAGEVLKIVYEGGSQPGATREIAPMSIHGDKVQAHCYTSNAIKQFRIEKIKILDGNVQAGVPTWQPGQATVERYESLSSLLASTRATLVRLGWHIENTEASLSLHRRRKNGTPLKGYDVWLLYEEYAYDSVLGLDGEIHKENVRKRQRPWTVRGKDQETKSFGALDKAAELFLELAKLLAPSGTKQ